MTNMKSRNDSESDVIYVCHILFSCDAIYVCHILFSCTSFMYGSCILHFVYVNVHRCLQVSLMTLVMMGIFFKWLRLVLN